jgi:hypothetical protein
MSERIAQLNNDFAELRKTISTFRKEGRDVFIADLMAIHLGPKIKLAAATGEEGDVLLAERLFNEVRTELQIPLKESIKNEPSAYMRVQGYIDRAESAVQEGQLDAAKEFYHKIRENYRLLNVDQKMSIKDQCIGLHGKLR